jgi:hypothetical protein
LGGQLFHRNTVGQLFIEYIGRRQPQCLVIAVPSTQLSEVPK